jgi:hypothetical protein
MKCRNAQRCHQPYNFLRLTYQYHNGGLLACVTIRTRFTRFAQPASESHAAMSNSAQGVPANPKFLRFRLAGMILGISPNCEEPHQYETGDEASDMRSIGDATCLRSSTKYS